MLKRVFFGVMLALLLAGILAPSIVLETAKAEPITWIVDDDGPADFHTIAEAINAANPGDTIYVRNGTYYEHPVISKNSLTLLGENKEATIIDGQMSRIPVVTVSYAERINVTGFTIRNGSRENLFYTTDCALLLDAAQMARISNNIISNCTNGITLSHSRSDLVNANLISETETAIILYITSNSTISDNVVSNSVWGGPYWGGGISLDSAYNNTVVGNVISNATEYGIWINSYNNVIARNVISDSAQPLASYSGGIHLDPQAHDNTILGNVISKRGVGVYFSDFSYGNKIIGNIIANITGGVAPYGINGWGRDNWIVGNTIENVDYTGIRLNSPSAYPNSCTGNIVSGNSITNTSQAIAVGFVASSNTVIGNNVSVSNIGLFIFDRSEENIIINNVASDNYYGIALFSSNNSQVYNNNFVNNVEQALLSESYNTTWDDDYPFGGNYWSNYVGEDLYNGPYQNMTGSDGIGDTPYAIDATNQDRYPLIDQKTGIHDVSVANVALSKTVIGQGSSFSISVVLENQGDYTEILELVFYANATVIQKNVITVKSKTSTSFTITLGTSILSRGNCSISIYAVPTVGEADIADNTFIDGWAMITIPGDTKGDKIVNVLDLILIAGHLGHSNGNVHTPYSEEWYRCMNCDVKPDGTINVLDLIVTATHLGQHWP